ncbi:MAG: hypothetical protein ACLSG5_07805 [Oscillospiraceae bacterium]
MSRATPQTTGKAGVCRDAGVYYFGGIDGDYSHGRVYYGQGFEFMPRTYSAAYLVAMEGETDSKKPRAGRRIQRLQQPERMGDRHQEAGLPVHRRWRSITIDGS